MKQCKECRSYAISINPAGDLCDVCYWRVKSLDLAEALQGYAIEADEAGIHDSTAHKALQKYWSKP